MFLLQLPIVVKHLPGSMQGKRPIMKKIQYILQANQAGLMATIPPLGIGSLCYVGLHGHSTSSRH